MVLVSAAARAGGEGLSGRSVALLAEEGIDSAGPLLAGPFPRRGVWGAGREVDGTEWLADRRALAGSLRQLACAAGAQWRAGQVASLRAVAAGWQARLRDGSEVTATTVVEARGRRGREVRGPALLAVAQRFVRRRPGSGGTGIAPLAGGWCWWAAGEDSVWVQVTRAPGEAPPGQWIAAAAAERPALGLELRGAVAQGPFIARAAHARLGTTARAPGRWAVGDAALALDPLSGQGVYEAIRGARLVATAVGAVAAGQDAVLARQFVAERQEESFLRAVQSRCRVLP